MPSRIKQAVTGPTLDSLLARRTRLRGRRRPISHDGSVRRLFVDLAVISKDDAGTGIQRIVRALALALAANKSSGWEICFVAASRRSPYHCISWPDQADSDITGSTLQLRARPGDVFLGLDFSPDAVRRHSRQLLRFRQDGGFIWFLVHDLLPLERPDWFSVNNVTRYKAWLDVAAGTADGFLCNSQQTEESLRNTLDKRYGLLGKYTTKVLPVGHDITESNFDKSASLEPDQIRIDDSAPFYLVVGTLEPRKGHSQVIAAFEELWAGGSSNRLVLVGRRGWHVQDLFDHILHHKERGQRLFWFDDVEDAELERLYRACAGVIVASYAEGLGLPLLEALGYQKPVLARDLPVFRAHEEAGVRYFPQDATSQELRRCIEDWAAAIEKGSIRIRLPTTCWTESAQYLLRCIA